jgi:hypothetical protein
MVPYAARALQGRGGMLVAAPGQAYTGGSRTRGRNPGRKVAIQTNNIEVDDRGYVYIVDRANTGMHILELTGAARVIANFP